MTTLGGNLSFDINGVVDAAFATVRHLKRREKQCDPADSTSSQAIYVDTSAAVTALVAWLNESHARGTKPYTIGRNYNIARPHEAATSAMPLMINRRPLAPGATFNPNEAPRGTVAWSLISAETGQLLFVGILRMRNGQWELVRRRLTEDEQGGQKFALDVKWYRNRRRHRQEQASLQRRGSTRSLARWLRRKASRMRRRKK